MEMIRLPRTRYSFEYLFATTMAGQPLAWFEASNLPEEAFGIRDLMEKYKKVQYDFHQGTILPIGEEPSGRSWTGFQSLCHSKNGYLLIYREDNAREETWVETWLPEGAGSYVYADTGEWETDGNDCRQKRNNKSLST